MGTTIDSSRWARRLQRFFPWIVGGHSFAPSLGRDEAGQACSPVGGQVVAAPSRDRCLVLTVCVFLVLAVGLVFGQALRHEFVNYDDDEYVYENPHVLHGLNLPGIIWAFTQRDIYWGPTLWLSFMVDGQFYGRSPGGYHLSNVLLHAATAVLLFLVLRRMTGRLWPSALVAALFAVHPLRVESVAWVTERKDVLGGLFFVLTLGAYVSYARHRFSVARYAAVMILFVLGVAAKPTLLTVPPLLLLLDYWPLGRVAQSGRLSAFWRLTVEKVPLFLIMAACCTLFVSGQTTALTSAGQFSWSWRLGNAMISYVGYLGQSLYPVGLAVSYPRLGPSLPPGNVAGALLVLAAITAAAFAWRRRCPYVFIGWLWYLGMFVPTIGFVQFGIQTVADRFTYLPQIGLCIALAWGSADVCRCWPYRRWLCGLTPVLVLVALMACAWRQTSFWRDNETLWTRTLACTPRNTVAHCNLGVTLMDAGHVAEALSHYRKAVEIDPDCALAHYDLGGGLSRLGRFAEALAHCRRAVELQPESAEFQCELGATLAHLGRFEEAMVHQRRAVEIRPDYAMGHNDLGLALAARGSFAEAIAHYRKALETWPDYPDASYHLGIALANCGQFEEAWARLQPALKARPNDATLQSTLGNIMAARGEFQDAVAHYRKALQIRPDDLAAQRNLAWLRATCPVASQRNGEEAVELAQRANRRCDGRRPDVLDTLAAAYAELGWFPEAVAAEGKALELATQQHAQSLTDAFRARMALYEARKPFRQPPPASASPKPSKGRARPTAAAGTEQVSTAEQSIDCWQTGKDRI